MNTVVTKKHLLLSACVLCLTACGDPLVGRWEAKEDQDVDLYVEASGSDYRGDGHIYLCDSDTCYLCPFDFDGREDGDMRWQIDGRFTGNCSSAGSFDNVECDMNDAEDELDCNLGGGTHVRYDKRS